MRVLNMSYPILLSQLDENRKERFLKNLEEFQKAQTIGSMRKVEYDWVKDMLNRCVDYGFRKSLPNIDYNQCYDDQILKLNDKSVMSLHDVISAHKQVSKVKDREHPYVIAFQAIADELIDLALQVKEMKQHLVKGRAPSNKVAVINPNKIIRQCPCCLREIAVGKNGLMVLHGYQRPGDGEVYGSCMGVDFPPVERSDEGFKFMVKYFKRKIEVTIETIENIKKATTLIGEYNKSTNKFEEVKEGDIHFSFLKERELSRNKYHLKSLESNLKTFEKLLLEWFKKE